MRDDDLTPPRTPLAEIQRTPVDEVKTRYIQAAKTRSAVAEMGDHLATIDMGLYDMGRNVGGGAGIIYTFIHHKGRTRVSEKKTKCNRNNEREK